MTFINLQEYFKHFIAQFYYLAVTIMHVIKTQISLVYQFLIAYFA